MAKLNGPKYQIIYAGILNPHSAKKCEYFENGILVLQMNTQGNYVVKQVGNASTIKVSKTVASNARIRHYGSKIILPAFFDMHFHWVQDDVRQSPKDSLLTWLSDHTWPAEAKFKDKKYANYRAKRFFRKLSATGTLGGACFSSIHGHALEEAFKFACGDFIIGNVLMTMNSPDYLKQTQSNALKLIEKFSKKFKNRYAFTPRFALTVHPDVMERGSKMAKKSSGFIQTHLSETREEIDEVLSCYKKFDKYKKVKTYTEVYKKAGLLGKKTLMAHGIHLSLEERKILSKSGTSVIHCPTSNAPLKMNGLGSGLCKVKMLEKSKIKWALGTDIGAGPFLSMFDVMESFVQQSKGSYTNALYRSTLAGAEILGLAKKTGSFAPGKSANFIVIDRQFKTKTKSAEKILKSIIDPFKNKRHLYDGLVRQTFLHGKRIY